MSALAATLGDNRRAQRFVEMTGIGTEELRRRAGEPALLVALLSFLEAYEPDLLAVSETLEVSPDALVAARQALETRGRP